MSGYFVGHNTKKDKRDYPMLKTGKEIEEYLNVIRYNLEDKEDIIKKLRERIAELESEHYKDKHIQELTEELNKVRADARKFKFLYIKEMGKKKKFYLRA